MSKTIKFANFPKLRTGEGCDGANIDVDGVSVGWIERDVYWKDRYASLRGVTSEVLGYTVILFADEIDRTFPTLAEARAFVRDHFGA